MEKVTVHRNDLLKIVKENKEKHDAIYKDAIGGFWTKAETELDKHLANVKERKGNETIGIHIPYPVSFANEYDQAIKMLEMSIESEITLTKNEFAQYAMNQWSWRNSFLSSNTMYVTGAAGVSGMRGF